MLNKRILVLIFVVAFTFGGCLPIPTPPNEAPIITSTPITTATVGVLYTYNVNATDPDGDTLAYSLVVKPSGMTINSATGLIKWTPTAKGDYPVTVKVSDGTLSINQNFTIKVKVVNHAPSITSIPITTATVGVTYVYDVNATDPNNDVLTYSLTAYPSGMTISSANGVIIWVPTLTQVGNNSVIVEVTDGALSDTQGFTITVSKPTPTPINQAPVIVSIPGDTATVGVKYTYTIKAVDPEGDTITYSLFSKPTGMGFDGIATISWTPVLGQVGVHGVIVKASDGKLSIPQNFTITVSAVEPGPEPDLTGIEVSPDAKTLLLGGTQPLTVMANYSNGTSANITSYCKYKLDTEEFVSVDNYGLVTAIGLGKTKITVSYTPDGEVFRDTLIVTVVKTIQEAIDVASAGDTIEVPAGTYNEEVLIDKQLTLLGTNANESIIDGGDTTAVTISANNVTVDGFTLDGGITLDDRLNTISGGTISNNIITKADSFAEPIKAQNGIRLGLDSGGQGVDHITIENNTISNNLEKGIRFSNTKIGDKGPQRISYITIRNNEIKDNGSAGMETYGPGFNIITGNTINGNSGNGINLKFDDDDVVTGNIITNNTGPGITLRQVTNSTVENNIVSGHQSEDPVPSCQSVSGGKGSGIHIFDVSVNNTIRFNDISSNNYGIFIHSKDDLKPSGNSINDNNISGNIKYGILNALVAPPAPVDATNNWWGSGGTGVDAGKPGEGGNNGVSANVDYDPWSTSKF